MTLQDVAKKASVSPATVSLVLRDSPAVHPNTRRRVQAAAGELGYKRRRRGRPAKHQEAYSIAVAYPGASLYLDDERWRRRATRRWFEAIRDEARRQGHYLSFFGSEMDDALDPLLQEVVRRHEVEGVIFLGDAAQPEHLAWVHEQDMPALSINHRPKSDAASCVEIDNEGGGRVAVEHLHDLGHCQIAMVRSTRAHGHNRAREAGYREAVQQLGLDLRVIDQIVEDGENRVAPLWEKLLHEGVTAVFCDGDSVALRLVDHLELLGVDVPGRVSVLGFDDMRLPSNGGLTIGSIGADSQALAECAVEVMSRLIRQRAAVLSVSMKIRTYVTAGDTVAPRDG